MKIDTSTIAGFDTMTPEQQVAALKEYDIPENHDGYVSKATFDKTASDLAKVKKDLSARMTEDEQAKAEREAELQELREKNAQLVQQATIAAAKAKYTGMGFDDALAQSTAEAWAKADMDKVMANTAAFLDAHDKQLKAEMIGGMPKPPVGSGTTPPMTKEDILKIENADERRRAIAQNLELFASGSE